MTDLWSYLWGRKRGARSGGGSANDDGWCMIYDESAEHEIISSEGIELHHISDKVLIAEDLIGAVGLMNFLGYGFQPFEISNVDNLDGLGVILGFAEGVNFPLVLSAQEGLYVSGEERIEVPRSGTYCTRTVSGDAVQVSFIGNTAR